MIPLSQRFNPKTLSQKPLTYLFTREPPNELARKHLRPSAVGTSPLRAQIDLSE